MLILCLTFFLKPLFSEHLIFGDDLFMEYYPYWALIKDGLQVGQLPLWNPYIFCGFPIFNNMNVQMFYPLSLLYLLMPLEKAFTFLYLIHFFMAGLFTFLFLRHLGLPLMGGLLGGALYMFNGNFIAQGLYGGSITWVCPNAYLPLLFLLVDVALTSREAKRSLIFFSLAGLVVGLQLLAGHPQPIFYALFCLPIYALLRLWPSFVKRDFSHGGRIALGFLLLGIVAALASGVLLVPALELMPQLARAETNFSFTSSISFPPQNLPTLFFPDFYGNRFSFDYWNIEPGRSPQEYCLYLGVFTVFLALFGFWAQRKKEPSSLPWAFLALFSFLLCLGQYTPLFGLLYHVVPGFKLFRAPVRFRIIYLFSMSVLAAMGLAFLEQHREASFFLLRRLKKVMMGFLILFLFAFGLGGFFLRPLRSL